MSPLGPLNLKPVDLWPELSEQLSLSFTFQDSECRNDLWSFFASEVMWQIPASDVADPGMLMQSGVRIVLSL